MSVILAPLQILDLTGMVHLSRACGPDIGAVMAEVAKGALRLYRVKTDRAAGTLAIRLEDRPEGRELVVVAAGAYGHGMLTAIEKPIRALAKHWGADTIRAHTKSAAMARLHRSIGFTNQIRQDGEFISFAGA